MHTFSTMSSYFCLLFVLLTLWGKAECTRHDIHEMMYWKLDSTAACFRRLNGTHQFGCSSERGGNIGIIHVIKNDNDLSTFLESSIDDMYMLVLYMPMFTSNVVEQLIKKKNIGGLVVVVERKNIPNNYSPDDVCPNSLLSSCSGQPVNPLGNKFLFIDWPFPMFMVDDENTTKTINECYNEFNKPFGESQLTRPLCSLQMKSHMSAAVNSPTCLRRTSQAGVNIVKYCDPIGDQNIILPMGIFKEELAPRSVIVIAARLDAASLFDGIAPGAITSVTGIVTLLTTAHILSSVMKTFEKDGKEVMFMLLTGEAHDYIGSSRIIYDMKKGDFTSLTSLNMLLENIMAFIEISQIDSGSRIFLHNTKVKKMYDFETELIKAGSTHSLKIEMGTRQGIPPASLQVFSKADPLLHGLVISSYDQEYSNKYFNGLLDNANTIQYDYSSPGILQQNVAALSASLASVVYTVLSGSSKDFSPEAFINTTNELFHCFLVTRLCKLMKEVYSGNEESYANMGPFPLYVGVQPSSNPLTTTTGLLLAYLTSDQIPLPKENCSMGSNQKEYSYFWVHGPNRAGVCINTTLKFTPAVSPAFIIPDYDWKSGNYSSWTESIWIDISLGMFLKPSRKQEFITFSTGLSVSFISFLSVFWLNKKSKNILFKPSPTNC